MDLTSHIRRERRANAPWTVLGARLASDIKSLLLTFTGRNLINIAMEVENCCLAVPGEKGKHFGKKLASVCLHFVYTGLHFDFSLKCLGDLSY